MTLKEKINQLPLAPGIYQYYDKQGRLLYIGKAKNLKNRVKSYFNSKLSARIQKMISQTFSMNYIVVGSEHDALILENSLIKQLNPKYNILLRDDKTYPYIYIDNSYEYPRLEITRKIIKSNSITYFGPYSIGAKEILDSIYEICKLVQKKGCFQSKKLCLYHQIDKCLGPCELPVRKERYKAELDLAISFIQNKKELIKKLQEKMTFYAQSMRFEEAGEIRDRIQKISRSEIKSDIDFASDENYDIFVIQSSQIRAVVVRIFMRGGKIISSSHDFIQLNEGINEEELYSRVLLEFYTGGKPPIIAPILVAKKFEDCQLIENHLSGIFEKKVKLTIPARGKKKHLVDLALLNAQELLKQDKNENTTQLPCALYKLLDLQKIPSRVEIFDNSHISGVATVGAMAVYENGKFDKKSYRTYHLKARDEYAQMRETLTRRVQSFSKNSPPDLWIIDGGATLLTLAQEILESNGVFIDVIAISKEKVDAKTHRAKGRANDTLYTKGKIFRLPNNDKRLQWIQNLRDKAHRLAISFHQKTKLKQDKESKLLNIKGISQAKIVKLLKHFGSFNEIKKLPFEEISSVLGKNDAKIIKKYYN